MAHLKQVTNGGNGESKSLDPEQFRKLFIGGLSISTTDDGLSQFYSQFGELIDCVVMRDNQSKKSRGFGFVAFSTKEEVDRAMDARPHIIDGRTVDPKRAVPRDQFARSESNISTKRLYVSGVREEHDEEAFATHFSQFGRVVKVEIVTDKVTQKPRGFCFITFEDYDSVDKCVLHKSHLIGGHRCDVKKALSKDDMAKAQQMDRDRQERSARSYGMQRAAPQWNAYQGGGGGRAGGGNSGGARAGGGGGGYGGGGVGAPMGHAQWNAPQQQVVSGGWVAQPAAQWNTAASNGYSGVFSTPTYAQQAPLNWAPAPMAAGDGGGGVWNGAAHQQQQHPQQIPALVGGGWSAGNGAPSSTSWTSREALPTSSSSANNNIWATAPGTGGTAQWNAPVAQGGHGWQAAPPAGPPMRY